MIPIFIHVPRTGGSTLRDVMMRRYPMARRCGTEFAGRLDEAPIQFPDAQAWYGHHPFGLHEHLDGDAHYLTVLRNPSDRIYSEMRRRGIANTAEFFSRHPHQSNIMTRMLSGMVEGYVYGKVKSHHLDQAIINISEHFFAAGVYERLEAFIRFLRWIPEEQEIPHINAGPLGEDKSAHIPHEHVEYDLALYDYVREIAP